MEARSKWLKANGKAPRYLGKHQRVILARAKSKADVKIVAITNKPSDVDGHRPHSDDSDIALSKRARRDTHDTPPHKRAALESSSKWRKANLYTLCKKIPRKTICNWNRYLARDPPSYDSGIPLSEADAKTMMDKIEARTKWLKANGKAPSCLGKHQRAILARAKFKADDDSGIPRRQVHERK